jgi:hypothetical protein
MSLAICPTRLLQALPCTGFARAVMASKSKKQSLV